MTTVDRRSEAAGVGPVDFDVSGMTCGSCAARVQRVLSRHDGVVSAEVNFATNRATVAFDPAAVSVEALVAAVERIGYGLSPVPEPAAGDDTVDESERADDAVRAVWARRVMVAAPLAAVIAVLSYRRTAMVIEFELGAET